MKNKVIAIALVMMSVSLAACGGNTSSQGPVNGNTQVSADADTSMTDNTDPGKNDTDSGKNESADVSTASDEKNDSSAEAVQTPKEAIKLEGDKSVNGLHNRYNYWYYSIKMTNYDSSWQNVNVTSSDSSIAHGWVDEDDPSYISYSLGLKEGSTTLTITADNMEPAYFTVEVVQGVGDDEPVEYWNTAERVPYCGRVHCQSTNWDIYPLTWDTNKGGNRFFSLDENSTQKENALVFKFINNNALFTTYYYYEVYGFLPWDISCFLGLDGDTKEAFTAVYTDYDFSGYELEVIDTGYDSPVEGSPLYFIKRTSPNNPVSTDDVNYFIYFDYYDNFNGNHEYVSVMFTETTWDYLINEYEVKHWSSHYTDEELIKKFTLEAAERIFNYRP